MFATDATPTLARGPVRRILYRSAELRAGWWLLLFVGAVTCITAGGNAAIRRWLGHADGDTLFLVREIMDLVIIFAVSWAAGRIEGRSIATYGLPARQMFGARFWEGMGLGLAAITALLCAMRAAGVYRFGSIALNGRDALRWAAIYGFVFLLVALREEFRARGYLQYTLSGGLGFWPAAVLTSAFFGYSHHANAGEDWIGLFNAGAVGLLFCLLLRRSGNLWMPIGFHLAFDWGETYLYGVPNSGHVLPGHLLSGSSSGAWWLSGGTVGPEGSVLCTLLLIAVWCVCARWLPRAQYPQDTKAELHA